MKIAIVGCGFAGLSSALFLSKNIKNEITLFDKFDHVQTVGAGIMIQPSSMDVLKKLDLYDVLLKHGEKVYSLQGINHNKKKVFQTDYNDYKANCFGIGIHRSILFNAMYEKCAVKNNISIMLNKEISDLQLLQDQYDLVIIANGSHSILRKQLPIKQKYSLYPYGCAWTTVHDETTTFNKLQQYVYYSQQMFGLLPSGRKDGKRQLSVFWSLPIVDKDTYSKEQMFEQMAKHHNDPILLKKIKNANFAFAVYADVWMEKFHYNNVIVIGDAAHGMSPQLGQGANMALIDSCVLSELINTNYNGNNLESLLEQYTSIRKPHIKFYAQASKFLTPLFQSDKLTCGLIRDYLFSYSQKLNISRQYSSTILCGRKTSWLFNKEIKINK